MEREKELNDTCEECRGGVGAFCLIVRFVVDMDGDFGAATSDATMILSHKLSLWQPKRSFLFSTFSLSLV